MLFLAVYLLYVSSKKKRMPLLGTLFHYLIKYYPFTMKLISF